MTRREALALAWASHRHHRATRVENYRDLRSFGLTRAQAAARLKVSLRTARRYERALREAP